jgi:hypothetical protein
MAVILTHTLLVDATAEEVTVPESHVPVLLAVVNPVAKLVITTDAAGELPAVTLAEVPPTRYPLTAVTVHANGALHTI